VIAAGRRGDPEAVPALVELASDRLSPLIARATALSLLGGYAGGSAGDDVAKAFRRALADPEPWLRRTAIAGGEFPDLAERLARLVPLLGDPVRAVRIEAASQLAGVPADQLRPDPQVALRSASAEYVAAMERSLDFSFAGHNLGLLYERRGDVARAEASLRRAIAVDGLSPQPKVNLATLVARRGDPAEAERLLREVVGAYPDLPEAAYSLGLLVAEHGSIDEAAELLARAASAMPNELRASYNAGLALAQAGRDTEAEAMLRHALALDPPSQDARMALADFLARRGRADEAREVVGR
jgi:tetratricopeptide (TPR) repeat protein